ncbi:MAG: hypothetical protein DIU66_003280 [Bacillota bacterium]
MPTCFFKLVNADISYVKESTD